MKKTLLFTIVLTVALAGILHGSYILHERADVLTINEVYKSLYPETIPLPCDPMTDYPFWLLYY